MYWFGLLMVENGGWEVGSSEEEEPGKPPSSFLSQRRYLWLVMGLVFRVGTGGILEGDDKDTPGGWATSPPNVEEFLGELLWRVKN